MKRNNTEQIGDVLRQFLRQQGLETPLNEYRLVDAWKDVVGPVITRYTTNLFIKNQVLYVSLSSSVIRQELMMGREMLIRNLNAQLLREYVEAVGIESTLLCDRIAVWSRRGRNILFPVLTGCLSGRRPHLE